ncbi:MAG: glycosyltransferase family 4 protein [Nitrospirae bacterium]|nr:glycosyltransferase family 4 protein [Nitrospirota bacterium]
MSWWLTGRFSDPTSKLYLVDNPNERSLHEHPTPRSGGLAIVFSLIVTLPVVAITSKIPEGVQFIFLGAAIVAVISWLDDRLGISPPIRLLLQMLAAFVILTGGFGDVIVALVGTTMTDLGRSALLLPFLFIVWMTNLYNFMDGMDGFAGGMGVSGFGFLALLGFQDGQEFFALSAILIVGANLGFLVHNFPPARIFMGDTGSATMGFMAAGFSLWGLREGIFHIWTPLLIFSPFIVDATLVLVRRALNGERVWEAHRSHYYQRLVRMGWGHRKTVLVEYVIMASAGGSAVVFEWRNMNPTCVLSAWGIAYALLILLIHVKENSLGVKPT